MREILLNLAFFTSAVYGSGCGGTSYDLHRDVAAGDIYREVSSFTVKEGQLRFEANGQSVEGQMEMTVNETQETDIFKVDGGQPTRLKFSITSSEIVTTLTIPSESAEETRETNPLLGHSVLYEREGNDWQSRLVGGEPTTEQQTEIEEYGNPWPEDVVPARKVKVGESWTMSGERLRQLFGITNEEFTGKLKVFFERVIDYKGETCAMLSVQADISGKMSNADGPPVSLSLSGEGHIYRSLATKIDVYGKISGDIRYEGDRHEDGQTIHMTIAGPFVIEASMTKD